MFHGKITPNGEFVRCEIALRAFLFTYDEALCHAAVLLGGRRGARLINAIREALTQPGQVKPLLRRKLLDLRRLLFLEFAYDEDWGDDACFALLEPDDPSVPGICLLADGFEEVLRDAGLIGTQYCELE